MDGASFSPATKNLHANSPATLQPFLLLHTVLPQQNGSTSAVLADQITTLDDALHPHALMTLWQSPSSALFPPKHRGMAGVQ